jgi:hypothetical protein
MMDQKFVYVVHNIKHLWIIMWNIFSSINNTTTILFPTQLCELLYTYHVIKQCTEKETTSQFVINNVESVRITCGSEQDTLYKIIYAKMCIWCKTMCLIPHSLLENLPLRYSWNLLEVVLNTKPSSPYVSNRVRLHFCMFFFIV